MTTTAETALIDTKRPLWRLLVGIIDQPATTFEGILARRRWWMWAVPLLILLLSFAVLTLVSMPYTLEMAREQAELR